MARIRSTKPEFWHDRKLARSCSRDARLFYIGLWNQADEHSRCNGDSAVLKGQIFPYDDIDIGPLLAELVIAGRVQPYLHDGDPFLFLPKLAEHQRLEPTKVTSKFPDPPTEFPDPTTVFPDLHNGEPSTQVTGESEKICVGSEKIGEPSALLYVAGSMEHEGKPAPEAPREDVERICQHLADRINDHVDKQVHVSAAWRKSARLLLDVDRRPIGEALRIIDWCQADSFWQGNILGMPKFREKYEQLRIRSRNARSSVKVGNGVYDDDEEVWMR